MKKDKPYVAKSMAGAQQEVRNLRRLVCRLSELMEEAHADRLAFAKLAADGPAFDNPLIVAEAKSRRNEILRRWCRLRPDGRPL